MGFDFKKMTQSDITIVIPCYNEYNRLPIAAYTSFLKHHPKASICFVNDASTDNTLDKLKALQLDFPEQLNIVNLSKNSGKAEAVRKGVLHCSSEKQVTSIAYLDADLATSLEECYALSHLLNVQKDFVFASRILKIGSVVDRKFSRFLSGRIIATFISIILDIKVYDTQCGCKVFKRELSELLFQKPFISKWLFDVELFSRILCFYGKSIALEKMEEIPVKKWIDQDGSKVKISYFFRLWYDLFLIHKNHKKHYHHPISQN